MDPHFNIRTMNLEDLKTVISWAQDEGWIFNENDAEALLHTDPKGFFIGEADGEPVCSFAAIKYTDDYCHWNLYIVKEQCRGKGYGSKIFEHARNYCKDSKVLSLDATGHHITNYQRYGFKKAWQTITYMGKAEGKLSPNLKNLRSVPLSQVVDYDRNVFGHSRRAFIQSLLEQRSCYALGVFKNGKLAGFGILRLLKGEDKYLVGPLSADDKESAVELYQGLQSFIVGKEVSTQVFDCNEQAMEIIEEMGWTHVMSFTRMYARGTPKMDKKRVYSPVDEIS